MDEATAGPAAGVAAGEGATMRPISRPESKKEALSTSTTPDRPSSTRSAPPKEGAMRLTMLLPKLSSELAAVNRSAGTRCGMKALLAGVKNLDTDDSTKATRYTIQSASRERTANRSSMSTTRERSAATILRLRSQRSTNTPSTEPTNRPGKVEAMNIAPVCSAEWVRSYT